MMLAVVLPSVDPTTIRQDAHSACSAAFLDNLIAAALFDTKDSRGVRCLLRPSSPDRKNENNDGWRPRPHRCAKNFSLRPLRTDVVHVAILRRQTAYKLLP